MEKLIVRKKNEAFVQLECEPGMAKELSEAFTFFVPGAQFSPQFRSKVWDGKIRLFHLADHTLYRGLIPYIDQFAKERKYQAEFEPELLLRNNFSLIEAADYANSLDVHASGEKLDIRDYQIEAFAKSIRNKRHLILSPTGSGKSLIDYLIIRYLEGKDGLIVVPTTSLVEQLYSDFQDYSSKNGWNVENFVHRLHAGHEKTTDKPILLSTWQSIFDKSDDYFARFKYIIGEEVHLWKAKSLVSVAARCVNAEYRIGLTGTLDGMKCHKLVLEGLFGPTKIVTTTKTLIDKGQLAKFNIKCLVLKYPEAIADQNKELEYAEEISFINGYKARNKFIRNLALSLTTNTLLLFRYVETHGQILYEAIKEKAGNRKVFFIHGKTDVEDREAIRKLVEKENDAIIVASVGTYSTGINIKNLHNIIFGSPAKGRVRTLQSIGRGLRLSPDKEMTTLYDIVDDMRHKKRENFAVRHFFERVQMYQDEKFPYKLYQIELKG